MTNFDSPLPAQLLRTTHGGPTTKLKTLPREKINPTETQLTLDLRGVGLTRTKHYLTGRRLT
jgi:hypothetical protein